MHPTATFLLVAVCGLHLVLALNNGLASKPPMGWVNWQRYRCLTDCNRYPDECVSEDLFQRTADLMVAEGYLQAGYEYLILDDCWMSKERDKEKRLVGDPERFPTGIKTLIEYVHAKGLKFGIYGSYGIYTCMGYPGSKNHLEIDANTFAEWGVDFLKFDGCYANPQTLQEGYSAMSDFLNKTGRAMVFSCSWPFYEEINNKQPDFETIAKYCNMWRNWIDAEDSYEVVNKIIKWYKQNMNRTIEHTGPGQWSDPDMLVIGNYGLSYEQSKAQMAIWAIMSAPLIMSTDLKAIDPLHKKILLNKLAIEIDQDELGIPGRYIKTIEKVDVWRRPILPANREHNSYALVFHSRRVDGYPYKMELKLSQFGLKFPDGYVVQDVFEDPEPRRVMPDEPLEIRVKPTGVVFLRASIFREMKNVHFNEQEEVFDI